MEKKISLVARSKTKISDLLTNPRLDTKIPESRWLSLLGVVPFQANIGKRGQYVAKPANLSTRRVSKTHTDLRVLSLQNSELVGAGIHVVSGEKILLQTDFEIRGPIPLRWQRYYRSSHHLDIGLGHAWTHCFAGRLMLEEDDVIYLDHEGKKILFNRPRVGEGCRNQVEELTLYCDDEYIFRVVSDDNIVYTFGGLKKRKQLLEIGNRYGCCYHFHYNSARRLTGFTDSAGRQYKIDYSITNHITAISLINSQNGEKLNLVKYNYSSSNDLIKVTNNAGHEESFQYQNHIMTLHRDRYGCELVFEWNQYDTEARCQNSHSVDGRLKCSLEYDLVNKITRSTDSRNHTHVYHYNGLGLITKKTDPLGNSLQFNYNAESKATCITDSDGNKSRYQYDSHSRITEVKDANGHVFTYKRDEFGMISEICNPLDQCWQLEYNRQGSVVSLSDPNAHTTHYTYNELGMLSSVTDKMSNKETYRWNGRGEIIAYTNALSYRTQFTYDEKGNLNRIIDSEKNVTRYHYNEQDQIVAIDHPDGGSETFAYNNSGQLSEHVDALERKTSFIFDIFNNLVTRCDPCGASWTCQYDTELNLTQLSNENQERYLFKYDAMGRVIELVDLRGQSRRYRYNAKGALIQVSLNEQRFYKIQRDALGWVTKLSNSHGDINEYQYDALGRLIHAHNKHAEIQFGYDASGNVVSEKQNDFLIQHTYNAADRRTATNINNEFDIEYQYNAAGSLLKLIIENQLVLESQYNKRNQEILRQTGDSTIEYGYEHMGRLAEQIIKHEGQETFALNYQFDPCGQLIQFNDLNKGSVSLFYDKLGQVIETNGMYNERYRYDPAGNRLSLTQSESTPFVIGNTILRVDDMQFEYDDIGNCKLMRRGEHSRQFGYDAFNQLIEVDQYPVVIGYQYDPLGRRVSKRSLNNETHYFWCGSQLIAESSAEHRDTIFYDPTTERPLCLMQNEQYYYFQLDNEQSVQALTDSKGVCRWQAHYDPLGYKPHALNSEISNNIQFRGAYYDVESELYYQGGSYYNPLLGHPMQRDPLSLNLDTNRFRGNAADTQNLITAVDAAQQLTPLLVNAPGTPVVSVNNTLRQQLYTLLNKLNAPE